MGAAENLDLVRRAYAAFATRATPKFEGN